MEKNLKYYRFEKDGKIFQFNKLIMGSTDSPGIFQTLVFEYLVLPILSKGYNIINYEDDIIYWSQDWDEMVVIMEMLTELCKKWNFTINWEKSDKEPTHWNEVLGFNIDCVKEKVWIADEKLIKIKEKEEVFPQDLKGNMSHLNTYAEHFASCWKKYLKRDNPEINDEDLDKYHFEAITSLITNWVVDNKFFSKTTNSCQSVVYSKWSEILQQGTTTKWNDWLFAHRTLIKSRDDLENGKVNPVKQSGKYIIQHVLDKAPVITDFEISGDYNLSESLDRQRFADLINNVMYRRRCNFRPITHSRFLKEIE